MTIRIILTIVALLFLLRLFGLLPGINGFESNEGYANYGPANVDGGKMGQYDNIVLKDTPNTNKILPDSPYTLFGTPTSLEDKVSKIDKVFNDNYPSVEPNSDVKSMFMWKNNKCSPDCCPSLFSCDRGCVCNTEEQDSYLDSRGENHPAQLNDY